MRDGAGRLITIEGLDGTGKTTLSAALGDALTARGLPVTLLREPGGVALGERIRALLAEPDAEIAPHAEALLFAAARAQLCVERLAPLLDDGRWVILDRFVDSSLAYQGGGRELGVETVAAINRVATAGCVPDRTLLLRLDRATGRARLSGRGEASDRIERESDGFFARVAATYDALAADDPQRIRTLDAQRPPDAVLAAALDEIADLLPSAA